MPLIYYIPRRDAATGEITTVVDTSFNQTSLLISSNVAPQSFNIDSSNFANDITVFGDARASSYTPYLPMWSAYFDGSGDYLSVLSNAAFAFGTGDFTVEAWINPRSTAGGIIWASHEVGVASGWYFTLGSNGFVLWGRFGNGSSGDITGPAWAVNNWQHVAVTKSSGTVRIFVNGVTNGTTDDSANNYVTMPYNFTVGADQNGDEGVYTGYISNLRVVKGTAVYTANFIPPTSPLTAISGTSLLTLQDNRFFDKSPNNFAITKNGDTVVSPFNPFATQTVTTPTTYSTYFDGTGYLSLSNNSAFNQNTPFTVECWVYNPWGPIFGQSADIANSLALYYNGANAISYYKGGTLTANNTNVFLTANEWHHFAMCYNGTTTVIYANGVNVLSFAGGGVAQSASSEFLVGGHLSIGWPFKSKFTGGYISNFRFSNVALYTTNFTPSRTLLTANANTVLLTCQNATFVDNSSNNFTISPINGVFPSGHNILFSYTNSLYSSTFTSSTVAPRTYSTYFDGSGDYITMPTDNALLALGSANFTFEAWVYRISGTGTALVFGGQSNMATAGGSAYGFLLSSTATSDLYISNTSYSITSPNPSLGVWAHVAWVRNGGTFTSYLNGVQVGSRSDLGSGSVNTGTTQYPPGIGGTHYSGGINLLNGYISNARLVKGTAVYTSNFTPPTTPLTAIAGTSFLACQGSTTSDSSANNIPLTIYGQVQQTRVNPFGFTSTGTTALTKGSAYFDGNGDYLNFNNPSILSSSATVECWIYMTVAPASGDGASLPRAQPIVTAGVGSYSNNANDHNWLFFIDATSIYFGKSPNLVTAASSIISINQWHHLAATISGTTSRLYLNGVLVATQEWATALGTTPTYSTSIGIGTFGSGSGKLSYFTGYISNLRITNNAVLYTSNFLPPTDSLTAITNTVLLTCQNSNPHNNHTFINSATRTSNLVLTRNGNATQGSLSPYSASWGGYFNGTSSSLRTPVIADPNGNFTIEFWWNPTALTGSRMAVMKGFGIQFYTSNALLYCALTSSNNSSYFYNNTFGTLSTNTWYHIALVRNENSYVAYLNGVGTNLVTSALAPNSNNDMISIGASSTNGGSFSLWSAGYISNVRYIIGTAVYTANFTPSTTPLTAIAGTALLTLQNDQFIDNSSNRFALTATGAPTPALTNISSFALNTLPTPTTYSGYFDGSGDYLTIPYSSNLSLNADFTIECWVHPISRLTSFPTIVGNYSTYGTNGGFAIFAGHQAFSTTRYSVSFNGTHPITSSSSTIVYNQWTHIALVRSGTTINLYINGVNEGTATNQTATVTGTANNWWVGTAGDSVATGYFNGYISNLRVVKGTAVYTSAFTPSTSPLTAISGTSLLTCQNSTFIDNSTNSFAITSFGQAKPSAINPFGSTSATADGYSVTKFKGSAYFDGTGDFINPGSNPAFILGTANFTLECWIYATAASDSPIFESRAAGSGTAGFTLTAFSSSVIRIWTGTGAIISSSGTVFLNMWTHIAVVKRSGTTTLYINGVSVGTSTGLGNLTDPWAIVGGGRYQNTATVSNSFTGYISDFRLVRGTAVYTSNFLPSSTPLLETSSTVLLLDSAEGSIVDATGKNVIETVGDVRISNKVVKYGTTAMYFDGTGDGLIVPASATMAPLTGNFTYECWVYPTSSAASYRTIFGLDSYSPSTPFRMYQYGTQFQLWYTSGTGISSSTIAINTWHHIAMTRSGTSLRFFVNGTQVGSTITTSANYASSIFRVGNDSSSTYPFIGYISDLRITLAARYTTTFTPPTAVLPQL